MFFCRMFIKHNALVLLEINKLWLGQHLSCQKFWRHAVSPVSPYNAHWAAHLTITSLIAILTRFDFKLCFLISCVHFHVFIFLFASLKSKTMTIVFSGISHNDSTSSTELTCDKASRTREEKYEKITSHPRQHGVRMSPFKPFIIQCMQVFRPEIELQTFRPYCRTESNLSRAGAYLPLSK